MTVRRDEPEAPRPHHWSFDQRINVGHLLTTLAMAASLFVYAGAIDKRIAVLEEKAAAQRERDVQQDSQTAAALLLIRNDLADMRGELREASRKIERYFDRQETRR